MKKLLEFIKVYNSKYKITDNSTHAEKLRARCHDVKSDEDWLQLEKEIKDYILTNPSESEMKILNGFCETVAMTCSAIRLK